jgi:hypothetical protein
MPKELMTDINDLLIGANERIDSILGNIIVYSRHS